jgi:hypothetical protein
MINLEGAWVKKGLGGIWMAELGTKSRPFEKTPIFSLNKVN